MRNDLAVLALALVSSAGCDPCAGMFDCRESPRLRVEGKLVNVTTGRAVPNAEVVAEVGGNSATSITHGDGLFSISVPTQTADSAPYALLIRPPNDSAFEARGLRCPVSDIRGSGCPLGLVVSRPYFPDVAEISYRGSNDVVIPSARVRFTRQAGAGFYGLRVVDGTFTSGTDGAGRVALFGLEVFTTQVAEIIGRLTVDLPAPLDSGWVDSVHLASALTFREARPLLIFRVGPSLDHSFAFTKGLAPAIGVQVTMTRVSGVATATEAASGVTDSVGRVRLGLRALTRGSLTVTLTVTPSSPDAPFTIGGIALQTHEDDEAPLKGTWDVGSGAASTTHARRR
jgi:hypothetical protein